VTSSKFCFTILSLFYFLFIFFTTNTHAENFSILAFGDSITQGWKRTSGGYIYGITSPANGSRTTDGYEPELEADFTEQTRHTAYVYNWGYAGETSAEGVNRIDSVLNSRTANFILIMEGANDLYDGVSAATTKANLRFMIQKSLSKSVEPILGTITPNTSTSGGYYIPDGYNPAIEALATEQDVLLADQYSALVGSWALYTSGDGLHLNETGEKIVAQTWLDTLILSQQITSANASIVPILELLLLK